MTERRAFIHAYIFVMLFGEAGNFAFTFPARFSEFRLIGLIGWYNQMQHMILEMVQMVTCSSMFRLLACVHSCELNVSRRDWC